MEVLVARIALYPDELVAAIVAAALYPVQLVQAQRYPGEGRRRSSSLKPDADWDGSVISLLNYPEIVTMMSDDLDWTEALGDVVANQQKEMLEAIQQLRDKAVAQGVLKSDEKTVVTQEAEMSSSSRRVAEKVYVPVYEPQMLYEPDYVPVPDHLLPRALSVLLLSDSALFRRLRHGCDLGRGDRLERLGHLGRQRHLGQ